MNILLLVMLGWSIVLHSAGMVLVWLRPVSTGLPKYGMSLLARNWTVYTGIPVMFLASRSAQMGTVWSLQGQMVLRTYTLRLDDLVALARSRVTRSLSGDECCTFLFMDTCP